MTSEVKIPETRFSDWGRDNDPQSGYDANWSLITWGFRQTDQPVSRMIIPDILRNDACQPEDVWKLELYTYKSVKPVRVVEIGKSPDIGDLDDAVIEAVRLGAKDAGKRRVTDYDVYLPYSGSMHIRIPALSEDEAISVVYRWVRSGDNKFFNNAVNIGCDYEPREIAAAPADL